MLKKNAVLGAALALVLALSPSGVAFADVAEQPPGDTQATAAPETPAPTGEPDITAPASEEPENPTPEETGQPGTDGPAFGSSILPLSGNVTEPGDGADKGEGDGGKDEDQYETGPVKDKDDDDKDDDDKDDDDKGHGGDKDKLAQLRLVKVVINDDGGTADKSQWTLKARLNGGEFVSFPQDTWVTVSAGTYKLTEEGPAGYDWTKLSCEDSKKTSVTSPVVDLKKGAKVTCTFTNDDKKQPKTGKLKLVKKVVNAHGGTAVPGDWELQINQNGQWRTLPQGQFEQLPEGTYQLRETGGPAGYTLTSLHCVDQDDDDNPNRKNSSVEIDKNHRVVCTFTNKDAPGTPTIAKTFDQLVHVGPGPVWEAAYTLSVTNPGPGSSTYTLFDAPHFAEGVTITGHEVIDVTGGNVPVAWDGDPATPIVTDKAIAAGAEHRYQVTFTVEMSGLTPPDQAQCIPGEPGNGLFNSATLEWDGEPVDSEACVPIPPQPLFQKVGLGTTQVDADTFALAYRLSVTNPGPGEATYTMTDTVGPLPTGVTLVEASAAVDPDFPLTPPPLVTEWSELETVTLASDQAIANGATHAYLVTVVVDVDVPALPVPPPADCADVPGVGYPIPNLGSIDLDGIVVDDEGCAVIEIIDLGIVKTHSDLEGGTVQPGVAFTYFLDVTNHGTAAVTDGVVEDLIPADLEVQSVTLPEGWTDASTGNAIRIEDVALAAGQTLRVAIEVLLPQPAPSDAPSIGPGEQGPGFDPDFIGELENTACVLIAGDADPTNDCDSVTVTVDQLLANVFIQCVGDAAFLNYAVATSPSLSGEPITMTWAPNTLVPAPEPPSIVRSLASGDSGQILWPGVRVAPNDVAIQWPGYRPLTIADYNVATGALLVDPALVYNGMVLDTSDPGYAWRLGTTVTLSVNPTLTISAPYPPPNANCAVPRSADLIIDKTASVQRTAPGASFSYQLAVTNLAVDSVADPTVVTDVIPAGIRVDQIRTSDTAFPRWRDCAVSGKDAQGYGGTLQCTLLGPLAMGTSAPPITLAVTVHPDTKATSIVNTAEVCWGPAADGLPFQACDDDRATVALSGLPVTGAADAGGTLSLAVIALLGGTLLMVVAALRRRSRHAIAAE